MTNGVVLAYSHQAAFDLRKQPHERRFLSTLATIQHRDKRACTQSCVHTRTTITEQSMGRLETKKHTGARRRTRIRTQERVEPKRQYALFLAASTSQCWQVTRRSDSAAQEPFRCYLRNWYVTKLLESLAFEQFFMNWNLEISHVTDPLHTSILSSPTTCNTGACRGPACN